MPYIFSRDTTPSATSGGTTTTTTTMTAELAWPSYSNKNSPTEFASVGEKGHHIRDCTKVLQKEKDKILFKRRRNGRRRKRIRSPPQEMA